MRTIFVVAGTKQEFYDFIYELSKVLGTVTFNYYQGWVTDSRERKWIYVSCPEVVRNERDFSVQYVGTWKLRPDLAEIQALLSYTQLADLKG